MTDSFLVELGKSGPWALVAGVLLWTVINAWNSDRQALTQLLTDFKSTLDGLKNAVDHLTDRLERIEKR